MQPSRLRQRHRDVGKCRIGNVSARRQGLRRRHHRFGKGQYPVGVAVDIFTGQRRHLRAVEPDTDRLPLVQRKRLDFGDDGAAIGADRRDIERLWWCRTPATRYRRGGTGPPASWWQRKTSHAGLRCRGWRSPWPHCRRVSVRARPHRQLPSPFPASAFRMRTVRQMASAAMAPHPVSSPACSRALPWA